MKRTTGSIAILLAASIAGLWSCRANREGVLRLRFWGDLEEIRIIEGICKDFEKAHPGIKIQPERKDFSGYGDILLQEFAAKSPPDVIFLAPDNMDRLTSAGIMADLTPYLAAEKELKASDYYDALITRFSTGDKLWLLPRDIAPVAVIYYNKALFDKAGLAYPTDDWHWEDLRADAKKLTLRDAKDQATQWGFADDWNIAETWVASAGGGQVDDYMHPTRITFGSGPAAEGILYRWTLLQKDRVIPSSIDNQTLVDGHQALFMNGKLAMFHSGIWKTPAFRHIKDFQWDVVRFPTKAGAIDPGFALGGSGYGMSAKSKEPAMAWELIKALSGPEGQRRMAATGLTQPGLKALADSPAFLDGQDPKNKGMLIWAADHGHLSPKWENWEEFLHSVWTPKTDSIWLAGYKGDPAAALKAAEDEGNQRFFKK